jgi:hypothetical protein
MTTREATRQLRASWKTLQEASKIRDAQFEENKRITSEYFGVAVGDEVEVCDTAFRYTKGVVISITGGLVDKRWKSMGTILVQPWNRNGKGNLLTRSHESRRQFYKKGILKVTRKAADVGPIAKLPRTSSY